MEAVVLHMVDHGKRAEFESSSDVCEVWGCGHIFDTACDDGFGIAGFDGLYGEHGGFE